MYTYSHTESTKASAKAIWQLWQNVADWPQQDSSITSAAIVGPFAVGSKITLKPKGSPAVKVVIKEMKQYQSYTTEGKLPLAKLHFIHKIETHGKQNTFTQTTTISGPFASIFARLMGKSMQKNLTARMQKMVKLLEA